jgi:tetratricopeptide (TPR) repeat protein
VTSSSSTNESSEAPAGPELESPPRSSSKGRRVRRRRSAAGRLGAVGVSLCALTVGAAPLAVGAVHRVSLVLFMIAAVLALGLVAAGAAADRRPMRLGLATALPIVFVVVPFLQSIPLPLALRGWLDSAGNAFLTDDPSVTHRWWPLSLDPTVTRGYVGRAAAAVAVFLCAYHMASGQSRRHVLPRVIAISGIVAVVVGLGHRMFGFASIYGTFATAQRSLLVGPFVNPNHNAEFLEIAAFACLACSLQRGSALNRYGWLTGVLLCTVGAIGTFSRAAVVALAAGGLLFAFLRHQARDAALASGRRTTLLWGFFALLLFGLTAGALGAGALVDRFQRHSLAEDVRLRLWSDGWSVLRAHPLGIGRGAFDRVFPIYRSFGDQFPIRFAFLENHPLQLLVDGGWLGFAAIAAAAGYVVWSIVKRGRRDKIEAAFLAGLFAVVVHSFTDFGLEMLGVVLPFVAVLGTVLGRCHSVDEAPSPRGAWVAAGVAVAGVIIGVTSICRASSDDYDARLKQTRGAAQLQAVARRAQEIHPTDYFYVLAEARSLPLRPSHGGPSPRLHALNRALVRCPGCEDVHLEVARSLWQLGSRGQALVEWRTAVQLQPPLFPKVLDELTRSGAKPEELAAVATFDARRMVDVADYLSGLGRVEEAFVVLDQADAMNAPRADSLIARVRLELQAKRIAAAQTTLAEIHAAGIVDPRLAVLDARLALAVKGRAGADDALAALDGAASRYPLDVEIQRERLALVMRFEKWQVADRAIEGLKVALYQAQGNAREAHLASARIQARFRRWTNSFSEYRMALATSPYEDQIWFELATVAEGAGRYAVAREAYAEAARLVPGNARTVEALRRLDKVQSAARALGAGSDITAPNHLP